MSSPPVDHDSPERTAAQSAAVIVPPRRPTQPSALPNILTVLIALILLAIYARPFADLDFTWQIRTGGIVAQTGQFRVADTFTYTIAGKQLPDFEWLYEVVLWAVWNAAGYGGLHLLKVLCVATPLALVAWRLRREQVGWHAVLLSLAVAILANLEQVDLRPLARRLAEPFRRGYSRSSADSISRSVCCPSMR